MHNQGQGHIRQRGKQSWGLKFDLGRDPATGKRITRHVIDLFRPSESD